MRTLFVLVLAGVGLWGALQAPFYGLLLYLWIAYFRPEQWVWTDLIANLNLSLIAGALLLARTAFSDERIRVNGRAALMLLFAAHSLLSTALSAHPDWTAWQNFAKCVIITVLLVSLVNETKRFRLVLLVIGLSLASEGAKQGWAQLIFNPGGRNDNQIPFLGDNNPVAIGMWMIVPVLVALSRTAARGWERRLLQFMTVGVIYRAVVTFSRGGFLTAGVVALYYLLRSRQRVRALVGLAIVSLLIVPVLPDEFWARMQTIEVPTDELPLEEQDTSSLGRVHFWHVALAMAAANPVTGVGHNSYNTSYDAYDFSGGLYGSQRSVHSVWFGVVAELGYVGLLLFLLQLVLALLACRRVRIAARGQPAMNELHQFAIALEVSILAFMVGGTFVPLAYNEMIWHFMGLTISLDQLMKVSTAAGEPKAVAATGWWSAVGRRGPVPVATPSFHSR